ncbi:MAG: hypothetical protein BMS9Abin29_2652 [Gemmatimonadota bacterium]|nr:MAG: hypothetical protein BMS9Abin29_2652 [Gemmatimonadota bacterium]
MQSPPLPDYGQEAASGVHRGAFQGGIPDATEYGS